MPAAERYGYTAAGPQIMTNNKRSTLIPIAAAAGGVLLVAGGWMALRRPAAPPAAAAPADNAAFTRKAPPFTKATPFAPPGVKLPPPAEQLPVAGPQSDAARQFATAHRLDTVHWESLVRLNRNWDRAVGLVAGYGETAAGKPLQMLAAEREATLQLILGDDKAVAEFHKAEAAGAPHAETKPDSKGQVYRSYLFE